MSNVSWPTTTYRVAAVINLIFVSVGFVFLVLTAGAVYRGAIGNDSEFSYFVQAFWTMQVINVALLGLLALGSICLWRLKDLGVSICNLTFVTEILYFVGVGLSWGAPLPQEITMSIAGATGVGNMGVSLQVICGYPLVGLVVLNWARRRRKRASRDIPVQGDASGSIRG